jgi:hypothetical protein
MSAAASVNETHSADATGALVRWAFAEEIELQDIEAREDVVVTRGYEVLVTTRRPRIRSLPADQLRNFTLEWGKPDTAVFPGRAVTKDVLKRESTKERLISLIRRFHEAGFSWSGVSPSRISSATAQASEDLIRRIPDGRRLPKILPDSEGSLMLMWESPVREALVIVDGSTLHLIIEPASPRTEYVEGLHFDGESIPDPILTSIP